MKEKKNSPVNPLSRTSQLIVEESSGEVLIYDLDRNQAHHLNRSASIIWKHCDGHKSASQIADIVGRELSTPVSEELVREALADLSDAVLLSNPVTAPRMTRRQMTARLGAAALAIPVILSLAGPTAAQACSGAIFAATGTPCGPTGATGSTGETGPTGPVGATGAI